MLRCFSENVDKRRQNILYADNLGGRPPTRPSAPDRDLPFVLQEVHDLLIELLQSVPRSSIDFHVELDLLFQPPLLERPIISAPPGAPRPPPPAPHAHARARSDTAPDERLQLLPLRMGVRELPAVEFRERVRSSFSHHMKITMVSFKGTIVRLTTRFLNALKRYHSAKATFYTIFLVRHCPIHLSSPISSYPIVHEHVLYHNHIMSSRRCTDEIQPIGAPFPKADHHAPPVH